MTHLLITVRFLDDRYHGLLDRGGPPEWPPSPFRLFQAMVAGVARRGELVVGEDIPSNTTFTPIGQALAWLQRHTREHPPIIIAPKSKEGQGVIHYVPNNDGDKKFDRQERLTAKPIIPTLFLLEPDQKPEAHYIWDISGTREAPVDRIRDAARSLTSLGLGIDMAFADADRVDEAKLQTLPGIRWYPKKGVWRNEGMLRTPTYDDDMQECTLADLRHCHSTFINRIEHGKPLKTVDKPKVFDRVFYSSSERPLNRPYVVFALRRRDGDWYSKSHAQLMHIAGMTRCASIKAMKAFAPDGTDADWIKTFVAGHRPDGVENHEQVSYVPLPSIGHEHADAMIRRVMIVAPFGRDVWLRHLAQQLEGQELVPEGDGERPVLERARGDGVTRQYTGTATRWATVTPAILPGHDDHKPAKTIKLIERALRESGIDQPCQFTWSALPNFKNCLTAHKYDSQKRRTGYFRPNHLENLTAVHLQLQFEQPVAGPVVIGAGRHYGFGLCALSPEGSWT